MTYATLQNLIDRYGVSMLVAATDRGAVATGEIDVETVERALADTDAMIDGYLSVRYRLPLADVPPVIVDLAQMIAIYKLHVYEPDPKIKEDYKDARRTLDGISAGAVRLPIDGLEPPGTGGTGVQITDRERPLTEANMKGFI